jgi:hypothetical protein
MAEAFGPMLLMLLIPARYGLKRLARCCHGVADPGPLWLKRLAWCC